MLFLSISEDSLTPSRSEIVNESTIPVYRWANGCFAEVFPVNPIPSPVTEKALKMSAIYGQSVHERLGNYDPKSQSLRTCQGSLALTEDDSSTEFLAIFPRAGMMRNGKLYRLSTLVRRTLERESGLSVTTPTASMKVRSESFRDGRIPNPAEMAMWQTPVADDSVERMNGKVNSRGESKLSAQVLWATPQAHDSTKGNPGRVGRFGTKAGGRNLNDEVALWPTPNTSNSTGVGGHGDGGDNLQTAVGGSLNPEFVEWLMGYPKCWTDIEKESLLGADAEQWNSEWAETPRIAPGVKNRVNRLKSLGNAIVPQVAELIFNLPFFDRFRA